MGREDGSANTPTMEGNMSSGEEREFITAEKARQMLPNLELVHTFRSAPGVLLGCDMEKPKLEAEIDRCQCELSGPVATKMKHGLVVHTADGPLFVETVQAADDKELPK